MALIHQGIPHPLATSPGPSLSVAKAKEDVLPKANLARPRTAQSSYSITKGNAASSGALVMALGLRVGNGHHIDLGQSFIFFGLKDHYVGVRKSQDPWARASSAQAMGWSKFESVNWIIISVYF